MFSKKVLHIIQSRKRQDEWYIAVTEAALYMAVGGFLEEANKLLQALWKYNLPHDRSTWLPDRAFEILWYASGKRPKKVPFERIDIDELEFLHRDYITPSWHQYADPIEGNSFLQAMTLAKAIEGNLPKKEFEKKALVQIKKYFEEPVEKEGYHTWQAFSLATELAAKNNDWDFAISLLKEWAKYFNISPYDGGVVLIACNRHVAPLLLNGIIKKELNLTKKICDDFVTAAIAAINDRIKNGVSQVYGDLSWKELLRLLSDLSIKKEPGDFTEEQKKKKWIGKKPASKAAIIQTEKRLGIKLPEDYKEFLKTSNGIVAFPLMNPELIGVEKLEYLKTTHLNRYGNLNMFPSEFPMEEGDADDDISEYIENAIAISALPEEQEMWLIPPNKNSPEWECWFYAFWLPGARQYKSFRYYIEEQIQNLQTKGDIN